MDRVYVEPYSIDLYTCVQKKIFIFDLIFIHVTNLTHILVLGYLYIHSALATHIVLLYKVYKSIKIY